MSSTCEAGTDVEFMIARYEGDTIDAFIEQLVEAQVKLLIDIRTIPFSRKHGFSKTALGRAIVPWNPLSLCARIRHAP
jgi:uncharacterized protein (DUF488 family)